MDAIVRKRVTKVGSGAWSVYLPKKWIDAWTPQQQESREVELRFISQSILITPVLQEERFEGQASDEAVEGLLCSAYIRGYNDVRVLPLAGFAPDTVARARDLLRHLDERIVADCRADAIAFTLRPDLPAPAAGGDDVLALLGAKVAAVLRLARDAIESHGHDVPRTLHALRLLRDTHHEDVDRVFYQAGRLVATLGIPLQSVSDYQLLGLTAAELHRTSEQALRVAETLLRDLGISMADLDYPRDYLAGRTKRPPPATGVALEMMKACRRGLDDLDASLEQTLQALAARDVPRLASVAAEALASRDRLQARILEAVAEHWGRRVEPDAAMAAFTASKHATAIQNALGHIESIGRHGVGLLAAGPEQARRGAAQ